MNDDIYELMKKQPHILLLGAGASIAVMKDLGLEAPSAMKDFIKNANLEECLDGITLKTKSDNLEDIYQELCSDKKYDFIRTRLEYGIQSYINKFRLPKNKVSIYDKILLAMKPQDCIYSFNWDPLLVDAKSHVINKLYQWGYENPTELLPKIHFLHGNVQVGFCEEDKVYGRRNSFCSHCGKRLTSTKLLYPDGKKIPNDTYGKSVFDLFKEDIAKSSFLTVYGYSAPNADQDYIGEILFSWKGLEYNNMFFKFVEVIDITHGNHLIHKWRQFYKDRNYFFYCKKFCQSHLAYHPRTMISDWIEEQYGGNWNVQKKPIPTINNWEEAKCFFKPLL